MLVLRTVQTASGPTLRVRGDLDLGNIGSFVECAVKMLDTPGAGLTLDLSGVSYCDSTVLGGLVQIRNRAMELGCELSMRGVSRPMLQTLHATGLAPAFTISSVPAS